MLIVSFIYNYYLTPYGALVFANKVEIYLNKNISVSFNYWPSKLVRSRTRQRIFILQINIEFNSSKAPVLRVFVWRCHYILIELMYVLSNVQHIKGSKKYGVKIIYPLIQKLCFNISQIIAQNKQLSKIIHKYMILNSSSTQTKIANVPASAKYMSIT